MTAKFGQTVLLGLLLLSLISLPNGCGMIHNAAADSIILPYRPPESELRKHFKRGISPAEYGLSALDKVINVEDSIDLHAWFFDADSARATIVVLHGFGGSKAQQLGAAEFFLKHRFNVVLYDARGHGVSGGTYCTHGVRERHDLVELLDSVQSHFGADSRLGLLGHSYGGSVALQTMAIDKRIDCAVVESTYSSLRAAVDDYLDRLFLIGTDGVGRAAYALAAKRADFDADSADNLWAARQIDRPVFLAHGTEDERLHFDNGERIRDAFAEDLITWHPIEGAGHNTVWHYGGEAYKAALLAFFEKHLGGSGRSGR